MSDFRSPVLGFNHNMKHRGLVFHVQTEDSGVRNPHIFTHCFHGGVILNSRKLDYDRSADEGTVKSLMQSLHKAMLKQLKKGEFDEKIDAYLGGHPDLLPSSVPNTPPPPDSATVNIKTPPPESVAPVVHFDSPRIPEQRSAPQGKPQAKRAQHPSGLYSKVRNRSKTETPPAVPNIKPAAATPRPRSKRSTAKLGAAPSQHTVRRGNVIISRPAVVSGRGQKSTKAPAGKTVKPRNTDPRKTQLFGSDLSSDKNLDDVIRAYLEDQEKE